MIWLSNSTLARLRDRLRERGERPSLVLPNVARLSPDAVALLATTTEYGPLCEAMYLMMSADGKIANKERDVLRGALRSLSEDTVSSVHIEAMLDAASRNVAEFGREARFAEVIEQLKDDRPRAEVAFVLAAAIAFADNAIADEENETLTLFAEGLGIDEARADELLDGAFAGLTGPEPGRLP